MQNKIKSLNEIGPLIAEEKKQGQRIAHCHGVFDLLHPGHIRHLKEAKSKCDKLIVSITPDRFVNKGPGRPVFPERLRLEHLASLLFVDYVVLNDSPDAISVIKKISPDIYVKGAEYRAHDEDITGKISEESEAVLSVGGKVYYTDDIVFSSSNLLNQFFDPDAERIASFIKNIKMKFSLAEILKKIDELSRMNVLVVGDAIIDEYQYVHPLGQSGKGVHLTAKILEKEVFLGGSLIIANHLAHFADSVTLLSGLGRECPHLPFIRENLKKNVLSECVHFDGYSTLVKRRYVFQDGHTLTKLFETYSSNELLLSKREIESVKQVLYEKDEEFDLILVCDFGNGFIDPFIVDSISMMKGFLAINTQTNSGNRGYNVVTHYHRADYISLNEPELRLAAHDRYSKLDSIVSDIAEILSCPYVSVTRGVDGVNLYSHGETTSIPALTTRAIDRVGAGDSYFALSSLCLARGIDPLLAGFIGSVAAAIDVQIIGNKEPINKVELCKYITRLMK